MKKITKNKLYQRILFSIVLIIILIISGFAFSGVFGNTSGNIKDVSNEKTVAVQTKKILPETVNQYVSASAVTKSLNEAKVSPKMTGNIANIYFEEGDWVSAGQIIIQLEQDEILLTAYNNAQDNLTNTRAAMKEDKKVAKVAVDTSDGDAKKQAKANLSSVRKKIELQIAIAQGQLDSAQAQLNNAKIVAPISGTVNQIYAGVGEMVIAGSPVIDIVNIKKIEIELALTELDVGKVSIGQRAEISIVAYPDEKFMGKVQHIGLVADPVSKKFLVKIKLENEDRKIKSGVVANVKIITDRQENVLIIPKTAVFMENNLEKIYLVDNDSKIKIVTIKTKDNGRSSIVDNGLFDGDIIVVDGNRELEQGDKIKIVK